MSDLLKQPAAIAFSRSENCARIAVAPLPTVRLPGAPRAAVGQFCTLIAAGSARSNLLRHGTVCNTAIPEIAHLQETAESLLRAPSERTASNTHPRETCDERSL